MSAYILNSRRKAKSPCMRCTRGDQLRILQAADFELPPSSGSSNQLATPGEHDIELRLGSGPDGQTLLRPPCGSMASGDTPGVQCKNTGVLTCSKCHLARYCSKACQTQHWKKHRVECNGPFMKPSWLPGWVTQHRSPAFLERDDVFPGMLIHQGFGFPHAYLWGNLPAIDCLNLPENEHASTLPQDFKLCFAASGDIRNLIRTVNSLPANYEGKCDILFNDWNSLVVGHNLIVLWSLLNPELPIDDAAEIALHLMYSSSLTSSMSAFVLKSVDMLRSLSLSREVAIPVRGKGRLRSRFISDDLDVITEMLRSKYDIRAASQAYSKIMCSRERQDFTDRHLLGLETSHRLAFEHYRASGVLAPYSLDINRFKEPNRLLYSPTGDWLLRDSDSPLNGWDLSLAFAHGEKHGVDRADVYGCLFFYVKDELAKFATRLRDCDISITLTMLDAQKVPSIINLGELKPFYDGCFDRIETSNLADYLSAPRILRDWGPCLNRQNKYAVLLINFMNWQVRDPVNPDIKSMGKDLVEKYASIMGIDIRRSILQGPELKNLMLLRFTAGITTFMDDYSLFQTFLRRHNVDEVTALCGLRLRKIHRIHPKRAGVPLTSPRQSIPDISTSNYYSTFTIGGSESTTRFIEFEDCN